MNSPPYLMWREASEASDISISISVGSIFAATETGIKRRKWTLKDPQTMVKWWELLWQHKHKQHKHKRCGHRPQPGPGRETVTRFRGRRRWRMLVSLGLSNQSFRHGKRNWGKSERETASQTLCLRLAHWLTTRPQAGPRRRWKPDHMWRCEGARSSFCT